MDQSPNRRNPLSLCLAGILMIMGTLCIYMYIGKQEPSNPTKNMKQIKVINTVYNDRLEKLVNTEIMRLYTEDKIQGVESLKFFSTTVTTGGSYSTSSKTTYTCIIIYNKL